MPKLNNKPGLLTAIERQRQIYINGASGIHPAIPTDFKQLEELAFKKMSKKGFDYVRTGAGRESTMRSNRQAFEQYGIAPKMLKDVSQINTEVNVLGSTLPSPILLSPVGVLDLAKKHGDELTAQAAKTCQIPMIISNQASASMEKTAAILADNEKWLQIYWSKEDRLVKSFITRAEKSGYNALVFTLDTTLLGWRQRDLNNAYLPFLEGRGIAQYVSDPVFNELLKSFQPEKSKSTIGFRTFYTLWQLAKNYPGSTFRNLFSPKPLNSVRQFISIYSQPALSWSHIEKALSWTDLPIILKGIQCPEDAKRAQDLGVKGLIVSNHGGRQVDGAIGALTALTDVRKACGKDMTILFDSGIRGGQDIFKAISLGADACCIGRPYVYGLAVAGQRGVEEIIQNYHAEFELTMALSGCVNIEEVKSHTLVKN